MQIDDVILMPEIVEKLQVKHHVEPEEVWEVFWDAPRFRFVEKGRRPEEDLYMAYGQTDPGRYLVVLFIWKPSHEALVLSARDMEPKDRRWYGRK